MHFIISTVLFGMFTSNNSLKINRIAFSEQNFSAFPIAYSWRPHSPAAFFLFSSSHSNDFFSTEQNKTKKSSFANKRKTAESIFVP